MKEMKWSLRISWGTEKKYSPSKLSRMSLWASSGSSASSGGRVTPQQDATMGPLAWITLPHTGHTYRGERRMLAARLELTTCSPLSSSGTEMDSAPARGSSRDTSGKPRPVSHFETALSLTPSRWASWAWVMRRASRRRLTAAPVI